jgi:hypothetical protein
MTTARDVENRIDDLKGTDEDAVNETGGIYIYDTVDATEPACIIGGDERD